MKTLLSEQQDSFYYCLLINLIYLKPGPRSKYQFNQLDLRFKNTIDNSLRASQLIFNH